MINNTIATTNIHTQGDRARQLADFENIFSQLQSSGGIQANSFPPALLQNLYQAIQNLLSQWEQQSGSGKQQNMQSVSEPIEAMPEEVQMQGVSEPIEATPEIQAGDDQLGPNESLGTMGDDNIKGTRNGDIIYAKSGNDRVYGRQGNDILLGQQGNDRLYGGKGDDKLEGGSGDDYLAGGRGNNKLFGGDGNDILYTRLGSDTFDGGRGNDTARIRASIDEYSIEVVEQAPPATGPDTNGMPENENPSIGPDPDNSKILLTHKETGQTIEVVNVEKFRFDDARLSLDEMKERTDTSVPPQNDQLLDLSSSQKENLLSLFDAKPDAGIRVVDKDGSGTISVGDTAVFSVGDASSVSQQFKTLSADDVAKVNGGTSTEPAGGAEAINKLFDFSSSTLNSDKKSQYENTLKELYTESPSFKSYIDKGVADGKKISLTANESAQETSHGASADGKNFTLNINENNVVFSPEFDLETNTLNLKEGAFSAARALVHEIVHATLGLNELGDSDLTKQFKTESHKLDAFNNFKYAAEFKADLERRTGSPLPADFDATTPERLDILLDTIGPGDVVRITNQVLKESDTHSENPRASYGTYSGTDWDGSPYVGNVLNDLYNDDLGKDNKLDLLYLTLGV